MSADMEKHWNSENGENVFFLLDKYNKYDKFPTTMSIPSRKMVISVKPNISLL